MSQHRNQAYCTYCHEPGHVVETCWRIRQQAALIRELTAPPSAPSQGKPTRRGSKGKAKRLAREARSASGSASGAPRAPSPTLSHGAPRDDTRGVRAAASAVGSPRDGPRAPFVSPARPSDEGRPPSAPRNERRSSPEDLLVFSAAPSPRPRDNSARSSPIKGKGQQK